MRRNFYIILSYCFFGAPAGFFGRIPRPGRLLRLSVILALAESEITSSCPKTAGESSASAFPALQTTAPQEIQTATGKTPRG